MVKVADPVGHIVLASSVPTVDSLPEVPMGEAEAVAAYGNLAEELSKQGGRFVILVFSHFAGWFTKPGPKRNCLLFLPSLDDMPIILIACWSGAR